MKKIEVGDIQGKILRAIILHTKKKRGSFLASELSESINMPPTRISGFLQALKSNGMITSKMIRHRVEFENGKYRNIRKHEYTITERGRHVGNNLLTTNDRKFGRVAEFDYKPEQLEFNFDEGETNAK